ncbi:hypothetical protein Acsp04_39130 [Actinomadura sp. NBRC 104425]|uniref:serine/threonine-protein kinase n=1 Tax=Actinomadura sp. NBRC 104425 TaxID=3032204 RepID=UPI0024A05C1C|nr:serine/threonine-protein kinase [Actinomadura sp. NBRC 104425]GLZ13678.1 hypothetical protein Acsp04_39130 [Actinomadura sp. NBRC 104425]
MGGDRWIPLAQRYHLLSVVGRGGMGTVWRAYDEMLDRDVAVKEVRLPEGLTLGERRVLCRRLIDEARATAALRHPGVVVVHDVVIEDGRPWIIMEYLRARSLHHVIAEDGPLSPRRAAEVGYAVLSVLRAAHDAGILHCDVKPSNVLLCDDGRILLADFGLAVYLHGGRDADTLVSGIQGSPAYLSPERVRGDRGSEASDMWSLGATLYAAVEGDSPFLRCHALASMVAVLLGEYEPPRRAGPLAPVIEGLLRQNPEERLSPAETAWLLRCARSPDANAVTLRVGRNLWTALREALAGWSAAAVIGTRPRIGLVTACAVAMVTLGVLATRWHTVEKTDAAVMAGHDTAAVRAAPVAPFRGAASAVTPPRTVRYHESDGYSLAVPKDWKRQRNGAAVQWTDPLAQRGLSITPVSGEPLSGLRAAEHLALAADEFPGYRRLRLEKARDVAGHAAEWEFTWGKTAAMHVLRTRTAGFEFSFFAPASHWAPSRRLYGDILATFQTE